MSATRGGDQHLPRPEGWKPGGPAPWAHLPVDRLRPDIDQVRSAMGELGAPRIWGGTPRPGQRSSAVLAAMYPDAEGLATVILTRRSSKLRSHRGQVSFPGGRLDPGETPVQAALREATEEVALDAALVDVVGELDHLATYTSGAEIAPFVGILSERPKLAAQESEVARIIEVSLAELLAPETWREERWGFPGVGMTAMSFFELPGDTVWGATSRMLRQLLSVVVGVDPGDGPAPGSLTP